MAADTMNNGVSRAAVLLLCLGLVACGREQGDARVDASPPPLAGSRIGGPLPLIDQDGRRLDAARLRGRYRLVYFGYTYCPDVCPTTLQHLMKGLKAFERDSPARAARVQPIFVTVDPSRDTPAVLRSYVAAFHPRLIGLTGSTAEIAAVEKAYAVYAARRDDRGTSGYLMDHSSQPILFDGSGAPIALVPADGDTAATQAVLDRWVR